MSEVELKHRTCVYDKGTIALDRQTGGWSYRLVYVNDVGETIVSSDGEYYVSWQAARANAWLAYERETGERMQGDV